MKKLLLLFILFSFTSSFSFGQCEPNPLYADSIFGVWPDTTTNFPPALINEFYTTQLDLLVPSNASQVPDAGLPAFPIDSAAVDNVLGLPTGIVYQCNSATIAPCTFLGGEQGCAVLTGTATELGTYDITIQLTVYLNFLGSVVPAPLEFEGYRVVVSDGTTSIEEIASLKPGLEQNSPNPFSTRTRVPFVLSNSEVVQFKVLDLLGQEVYSTQIEGVKGKNVFEFEPDDLGSGIYMYAISSEYGTVTKRMVYDRP